MHVSNGHGWRPADQPGTTWKSSNEDVSLRHRLRQTLLRLSLTQKLLVTVLALVGLYVFRIFLAHTGSIVPWLFETAHTWRTRPYGALFLWLLTFTLCFPPLLGYGTAVTLAGYIYGLAYGWPLAASASIAGSTAAFLASRTLLRRPLSRFISRNRRLAAFALALKQRDSLALLCLMRLCPLPFALTNGALGTFDTVSWYKFALANLIASPKLATHVFIGSKLALLAEHGDQMDENTKMVQLLSIVAGIAVGFLTGWLVYRKTKALMAQIEAEERRIAV